MDLEIARALARAGFRSVSELGEMLPVLKEGCTGEEYENHAVGIAAAINAVMTNTVDRAIAEHPLLRGEIDKTIARRGRYR